MEKKKSLSFNKRFILSIKDIDKYNLIGIDTIGNSFKYIVLLITIFSIILSVCITFKSGVKINKASDYIKDNLPEFEISNNQFSIQSDEPIEIESKKDIKFKVILDNSTDLEKYNDELQSYNGNMFILLKDRVIMRYSSGLMTEGSYDDIKEYYKMDTVNKETVLEKINGNGRQDIYFTILFVAFAMTFIINFVSTLINVLALSLLGIIIAKLIKTSLKYSAIFNMSISAITLPTLLSLIYSVLQLFTGFNMEYFQIMYTIVSYIYLIAAILIIRSEENKKKQEIVTTIQITNLEKEKQKEKEQEENDKQKQNNDENKEKENTDSKDNNKDNKDQSKNKSNEENKTSEKNKKTGNNEKKKEDKPNQKGKSKSKSNGRQSNNIPTPQENIE